MGVTVKKLLLLLTALIWGVAFVAQSVGMDYMGPFTFNGARFLLGSAVLLPVIIFRRGKVYHAHQLLQKEGETEVDKMSNKTAIIGGICCGFALCFASLFQQFGIKYTTVGKAGFITTLYIIIVPLIGIFMKNKPGIKIWAGVVLAAFGFYLLCINDGFILSLGDGLVFIGAVLFSIHILVIDYFSPKADGVKISCIQFLTAGIISGILALVFESPELSQLVKGIIPLAYAGILSCGVGYTLQVIGQRDTEPTVASLLLSMESVFSVLAGWIILNQSLSVRELAGCGLVFGAVILVQLPDGKKFLNK